jgi:6-methylsalicylate decarboxylase
MIGTDPSQRRQFLLGLSATGAAMVLPRGVRTADAAAKPHIIDVHHHVMPPAYVDFQNSGGQQFHSQIDVSAWTLKGCLADMDKYGIATAIVSWPDLNGQMPADQPAMLRKSNEWCAQLARDYPGRFGSFATMPLPDTDATLKEIAYSFDTLHVDGMRASPSYRGKYLGDPSFEPVLAELNRRKAVVFVHPAQPQCCGAVLPTSLTSSSLLEFPFDTMRTITSLLLTGSLSKYPDIRWIFSHGGGTLPMLAGRVSDQMRFNPKVAPLIPHGVMYEFKKLYVDTASSYFPTSWPGMMAVSGPDHILFGTDDPYIKVVDTVTGLGKLHLPPKLHAKVDRENALPLFPRPAKT